jgi:rhamnose utilization protein RhaD (predicted bifunctional aldolase and dehydrogenase)
LVVAADTVDDAEELLRKAVFALQRPARTPPKPDGKRLNAFAKDTDYRIPLTEGAHHFALDPWAHAQGSQNVYYPDHVVFLGSKIPDDVKSKSPAIAFYGAGVLIHKDAGPCVEPMLRCLGDVFRRLDPGTPLKALNKTDVDQLLNWDAEKYRQKVMR